MTGVKTKEALNERKALVAIYLKKQQPKRAIGLLKEIIQVRPQGSFPAAVPYAQELEKEGLIEEAIQEQIQIGDLYNRTGY